MADTQQFFSAALSAGAILTGFCGTFLSFRIQREANYHRQVAVDYEKGEGRDVLIGLSHFSSGFLMLIIASLVTIAFGLVLPLLSLVDVLGPVITPKIVAAGLLAAVTLICVYFWIELRHYEILTNQAELGSQTVSVAVGSLIAVVIFVVVCAL
jgi:hypothetical protein